MTAPSTTTGSVVTSPALGADGYWPRGWLVNDQLTAIPGTRTLWHELLDGIPNLVWPFGDDYIPYPQLVAKTKTRWLLEDERPAYVIRNATGFPPLGISVPEISLFQDILPPHSAPAVLQGKVVQASAAVVYNSAYTVENASYAGSAARNRVIPLGVDVEWFRPDDRRRRDYLASIGTLKPIVMWVGSGHMVKGIDRLIAKFHDMQDVQVLVILKDEFKVRVPEFVVRRRLPASEMLGAFNAADVLVCTSRVETQHLASLEACACDTPVVTLPVGAWAAQRTGAWGRRCDTVDELPDAVRRVLAERRSYTPRQWLLDMGLDIRTTIRSWRRLVREVLQT